MEIAGLIGILAAFFAGAYIRQPYWGKGLRNQSPGEPESREAGSITPGPVSRASAEAEAERLKREEDRIAQLQNMLNYIGRGQGRED